MKGIYYFIIEYYYFLNIKWRFYSVSGICHFNCPQKKSKN